ncbi:MAG: hypothetical protein EOR68_03785 [Mesorhizobium sp.]|uniref:hypothetical protein n=1 Tax=Mesorhizobium sp. TaxID=1871066 RepID=UPI000FE94B99|nr:hypothetical protein [Mesorhizobium sp.]RWM04337.1 MAG: hypothetical protein EOR68_03785 [Mesorhizobium sp.]TIP51677.1 MAG: hypothetical protein E5X77_00695 [Mesorhizobium sp.]
MKSAVRKFVPRGAVDPTSRLDDLIRLARHELGVLIRSEDWELPSWSVGGSFRTKGQNRRNRFLHFYQAGSVAKKDGTVDGIVLDSRYIDFAKAYCRYTHATSPVQYENQFKRLKALQFIEGAFRSLGLAPHISDCNPTILNTAVTLAKQGVGAGRHYQLAMSIEQVHRFCDEHRFYNAPFQWRHAVRKPKDRTEELGEIAKEWREDRLPSPEAYSALAHVFRNATTFTDKLMSAVSAICSSIPIRAHEVLQLRDDCEVWQKPSESRPKPDSELREELDEVYGIRVWPGKGNLPQVKPVVTVMVPVVQEAVQRLRDLCRPGREIAAWCEAHPGQLWLPPELEHLRETELITHHDLGLILGLDSRSSVNQWLNGNRDVQQVTDGYGRRRVRFADVQRVLLDSMPSDFPWFNGDRRQPYSSTLIVVRRNEVHATRATCPCMVGACTVQTFEHWLSGHDDGKKPSVFARWGFTERDGSPIEITTHSFRHWLNTVAQFRGMSDLDIAKWSGREPSQNQAYNHVTPEETLSQIRELLEENGGKGPLFEAANSERINRPISRQAFLDAQIGSAHMTDFGTCIHDYSLLPCQMYGDCLGCSENVFVKGDSKHRKKIEEGLELAEKQLEQSRQAEVEEIYGADRWTQHHVKRIEKMRAILAIHRDDSIPDGTVINLEALSQDNEILMALRDRDALHSANDAVDVGRLPEPMWGD